MFSIVVMGGTALATEPKNWDLKKRIIHLKSLLKGILFALNHTI